MTTERSYRPSNGTEGACFMELHCLQCIHEKFSHSQNHDDAKCDILSRSFLHQLGEKDYPVEWVYKNNIPTCTAFVKWDWGNEDDGWNEPDPDNMPVDDPAQLCFDFEVLAIMESYTKPEKVTA